MDSSNRWGSGREQRHGPVRILVVDTILGSRFLLAQAVSQPGHTVDTAANASEARSLLAERNYALVLVDHRLGSDDGIALLSEIQSLQSGAIRALVTDEQGIEFKRSAISRAGLAFVVSKPWSARALRETIREVLTGDTGSDGWARLPQGYARPPIENTETSATPDQIRNREILLRGLLAGLNSCEFESEVFDLVHAELSDDYRVSRWLWVDEEESTASRVAGDWPVESGIPVAELSQDEFYRLEQARRSLRVTRLDDSPAALRAATRVPCCLSLAIRSGGKRTMTGMVWADHARASELASLLRELQGGLQMAFQRIREAEVRAIAARALAERVSEELRTPVGALTHAINRLRGEVERAGMPTEWVDRVSSESERVVRAVEHLEGEMLSGRGRVSSPGS